MTFRLAPNTVNKKPQTLD